MLALGADAANVFVADPKVAEVRPASANTLFVFGVGPGRTTVAAMDSAGHVLAQFEVTVRQSGFAAGEAEAALARLMPASHIGVVPQAKGMLLTGKRASRRGGGARRLDRPRLPCREQSIENQIAVGAQVQIVAARADRRDVPPGRAQPRRRLGGARHDRPDRRRSRP